MWVWMFDRLCMLFCDGVVTCPTFTLPFAQCKAGVSPAARYNPHVRSRVDNEEKWTHGTYVDRVSRGWLAEIKQTRFHFHSVLLV